MFDGVPTEHFHRFISSTIPPPNSSLIHTPPISTSTNLNFLSFDHPVLFPPLHHPQTLFQSNHYNDTDEGKVDDQEIDLGLDRNDHQSWSNDEVIQLLRIKSSSQNWFKDLTNWDHVSRKLAEMGYKRSSEKCKEKFEEETCSRSFSNSIGGCSKKYLISEELDEHLCNNTHHHVTSENIVNHQDHEKGEQNLEASGQKGHFGKDPMATQPTEDDDAVQVTRSKKRKRKHKKLKMVKGLCVDLVNKMMAQQEEMHKKLLQDMARLDEEKMKREEAWRKEEMERVQMEFHISWEHEQKMARDRQSTITQFLYKITSLDKIPFNINLLQDQLQAYNATINIDNLLSGEITKIPSSENIPNNQDQPIVKDDDQETGKRWPRDEVLALINVRSINVKNGIGGNCEEHQGGSIWERISQGMLELGYKRSAKRCKEKWENINKYFRKTKDANKKLRSLESRTCPYYHELTKLYNQETKLSNSTGLSSKITPEN